MVSINTQISRMRDQSAQDWQDFQRKAEHHAQNYKHDSIENSHKFERVQYTYKIVQKKPNRINFGLKDRLNRQIGIGISYHQIVSFDSLYIPKDQTYTWNMPNTIEIELCIPYDWFKVSIWNTRNEQTYGGHRMEFMAKSMNQIDEFIQLKAEQLKQACAKRFAEYNQ